MTVIADPAAFIRTNTRLQPVPHAPEITLWLADEVTPIWRLTEEELGELGLPPPFWAFAWAGGQALARYLLDHPQEVAGKRVLDFAAGSGLVGVAAMRAGAASGHDCVLIEHQTSRPFPGISRRLRVRTMTDGDWRLSIWDGLSFGELYDLRNDPGEIVNRWNDPAWRAVRSDLSARMLAKMIDLQDRAPFPVAEA